MSHAGDEGFARPSSAAPSSMRASVELAVPEAVLAMAQQHAGQEGGTGGRPGSAAPSSLTRGRTAGGASAGGSGGSGSGGGGAGLASTARTEVPAPPEVLQRARQYTGGEGQGRPSSAAPSSMRASAGLGAQAPDEVLVRAQMYYGTEGAVRPGSAAPSSLHPQGRGASSVRSSREGPPVPEEVLIRAGMFYGYEGEARPGSALPSRVRGGARGNGESPFLAATRGLGATEPPPTAKGRTAGAVPLKDGTIKEEDEGIREDLQEEEGDHPGHQDQAGGSEAGEEMRYSEGDEMSYEGGYAATEDDAGSSSWQGDPEDGTLSWRGEDPAGLSGGEDGSVGGTSEEEGYAAGMSGGGGRYEGPHWQRHRAGEELAPIEVGGGGRNSDADEMVAEAAGDSGEGFGHFVVTPSGVARADDSEGGIHATER